MNLHTLQAFDRHQINNEFKHAKNEYKRIQQKYHMQNSKVMNPPDVIKSVAIQKRTERSSIDNYLDCLADMPLEVGLKNNNKPMDDNTFN